MDKTIVKIRDIGIWPEDLPATEGIKKLECQVASEQKKIEKATQKLPKQLNVPLNIVYISNLFVVRYAQGVS